MPTIRNLNPFRRQDENVRPGSMNGEADGVNGSAPKPVDMQQKEPIEYQLSEINDSGVFVPPSPPERKSFWTTSSSRTSSSSNFRSCYNENEPFNISRESFDSYRRSFDISARSPIIQPENRTRTSLDSRTFAPLPRHSNSYTRPVQAPLRTQKEEDPDTLEDVSLEDPKPAYPPKKRGVFSRIMDSGSAETNGDHRPPSSDSAAQKSSWHHFGARKRGQSGQGSELGSIIPKRESTPKPSVLAAPTPPPAATVVPLPVTAATEEVGPVKKGLEVGQTPEVKIVT